MKIQKHGYEFIHNQNFHPAKRMADGSMAITKAGEDVFGSCPHCQNSTSINLLNPQAKSKIMPSQWP